MSFCGAPVLVARIRASGPAASNVQVR